MQNSARVTGSDGQACREQPTPAHMLTAQHQCHRAHHTTEQGEPSQGEPVLALERGFLSGLGLHKPDGQQGQSLS